MAGALPACDKPLPGIDARQRFFFAYVILFIAVDKTVKNPGKNS
jgi:hypothetical protein